MYRGLSDLPKLRILSLYRGRVVGERSMRTEAEGVTHRGVHGSENVGMSSKKVGENPAHRKTKVSWATQIDPGLVGS